MRAVPAILALGLVVGAASSVRAQQPSDTLAALALSEEVFPQERGTLQWQLGATLAQRDEGTVLAPAIGLELGVLDGLEVGGSVPLDIDLATATGGVGRSELGLLWGPLEGEDRGVSLLWNSVLPGRSGIGDAVIEHDVEVIGHLSIDRLHAQVATGVEVQHGARVPTGRSISRSRLTPHAT